MNIIGCDFHPAWQQAAVFDEQTAEIEELRLSHADGEAERFYRALSAPALIGVEASGNSQWFLDLVQRLGHEVGLGNTAEIRASYVRKQKTDRRDILTLPIKHAGAALLPVLFSRHVAPCCTRFPVANL